MGEGHLGQHLLCVPFLSALVLVLQPPALSDTTSEHRVCASPGHHPRCSTHMGQPSQGKEELQTEWPRSWSELCPGRGGEEAGDVTLTPHTRSIFTDGPSVSPGHAGCVEPSRAQPLGKDGWKTGAMPDRGRPDSRARRVGGGSVQNGARPLQSHDYTHLENIPLPVHSHGGLDTAR